MLTDDDDDSTTTGVIVAPTMPSKNDKEINNNNNDSEQESFRPPFRRKSRGLPSLTGRIVAEKKEHRRTTTTTTTIVGKTPTRQSSLLAEKKRLAQRRHRFAKNMTDTSNKSEEESSFERRSSSFRRFGQKIALAQRKINGTKVQRGNQLAGDQSFDVENSSADGHNRPPQNDVGNRRIPTGRSSLLAEKRRLAQRRHRFAKNMTDTTDSSDSNNRDEENDESSNPSFARRSSSFRFRQKIALAQRKVNHKNGPKIQRGATNQPTATGIFHNDGDDNHYDYVSNNDNDIDDDDDDRNYQSFDLQSDYAEAASLGHNQLPVQDDDDPLVAVLVTPAEIVVDADPVIHNNEHDNNAESLAPIQKEVKTLQRRVLFLVLLVVLVISGAIGGIVTAVLTSRSSSSDNSNNTSNSTTITDDDSSSSQPSLFPSSVPSFEPSTSIAPSLIPSFAPSSQFQATMLNLIQSRSPSTNLFRPNDPQTLAFHWIVENDFQARSILIANNEFDRLIQRFALITLFYSMDARDRRDLDAILQEDNSLIENECRWGSFIGSAFGCNPTTTSTDNVDSLTFASSDKTNALFVGTLPREVGLLTSLTRLFFLNNRQLTGTLPSEMGNLFFLKELQLNGAQLSGTIPSELGLLTSLTFLNLELNNALSGCIPSHLGLLTNLRSLHLRSNRLNCSFIPTELGRLSQLRILSLNGNNNLQGSLPDSLCQNNVRFEIDCENIVCECCECR